MIARDAATALYVEISWTVLEDGKRFAQYISN
jgi:hypothetical protein